MAKFIEKRKQIEKWYDQYLEGIKEIVIMPERDVLWMYDVLADKRDELREFLAENGIETRLFFKSMSTQPMYKEKREKINADFYGEKGLYLPTYTKLIEQDIIFITDKIKDFYKK